MHIDIVNVTGTSIDPDGFQSTQYDAYGEEQSGVAAGQAHHFFGSWGRAPDPVVGPSTNGVVGTPDPAQSAQMLLLTEGGVSHAFDLQHVPTVGILPTPQPGEHIAYSQAGCFTRHFLDGSIAQSTTDQGGGQKGATVTQWVRPTEFIRFAPWGRETFDATGYRIKTAGGARFALGFVGGLPAPLDGGQSYARLQAQIIEINGSAISIGPTGSIQQPVAQALPLSLILTDVAVALVAVQAALTAIATFPALVAFGVPPAVTAAGVAVTAASISLGGALAAVSTQTAIG